MNAAARLAFLLALLAGCTYRIDPVPPPVAFTATPEELFEAWPDLAPVFPDYGTAERMGMARADVFLATWGAPETRSLSWWNLWPGNWPFVPQYVYAWQLADKRVQCRIDHPFYAGFAKTVCNCHFVETE